MILCSLNTRKSLQVVKKKCLLWDYTNSLTSIYLRIPIYSYFKIITNRKQNRTRNKIESTEIQPYIYIYTHIQSSDSWQSHQSNSMAKEKYLQWLGWNNWISITKTETKNEWERTLTPTSHHIQKNPYEMGSRVKCKYKIIQLQRKK